MVKPVKREQTQHSQQSVNTKGISASLQKARVSAENFVIKGRGKSALGAGSPPNFSDQAPKKDSRRVSQAVNGALLSKRKK
jgi:hypothetical protein